MSLRLVEVFLSIVQTDQFKMLLKDHSVLGVWYHQIDNDCVSVRFLAKSEDLEPFLDALESRFSISVEFRVILLPVEAVIPRLKEPEPEQPEVKPVDEKPRVFRINREELRHDLVESAHLTSTFVSMVILSAIVAAVGLLRGNPAIIIGAMVIAPLLGPNMALSLAFTLADSDLARQAIRVSIAGTLLALFFAVIVGMALSVDPLSPEIASRTEVGLGDILLALASGAAGAISLTAGVPSAFVGVMVAVALLPPLVTCGMMIGAGYLPHAARAFLLLLTNVICVNLAAITTFRIRGIQPRTWWEADRARKASRMAIGIWVLLLLGLVALILVWQKL
ncbi:MAG: TIGR00341 family protein [bacterium]